MKKILLLAAMVAGLAACSSNSVPTPQHMATNDLDDIPNQSQVELLALTSFETPKNGVTVVKSGPFQTQDKVYQSNGHSIIIPRRAVLEGLYTNDGTTCTVVWKEVYPSIVEYRKQRNPLDVENVSSAITKCDPKRGIKSNDRLIVNFDPSKL